MNDRIAEVALQTRFTDGDMLAFLDGERATIEIDKAHVHALIDFKDGAFVLKANYGRIEYEGKFSTLRAAVLQMMEECGLADDLRCDSKESRALAEADARAGEYPL